MERARDSFILTLEMARDGEAVVKKEQGGIIRVSSARYNSERFSLGYRVTKLVVKLKANRVPKTIDLLQKSNSQP